MAVWYTRAAKLGTAFDKYIRMPLLQRKTQAVKQLRSWIETVKAQYGYIEWLKNENGNTILDYCVRIGHNVGPGDESSGSNTSPHID